MLKVAVIGATGYTGEELVKILAHHSSVELTYVSGKEDRLKKIQEIFPYLRGAVDLECRSFNQDDAIKNADLVFLSLPHTVSMKYVPFLLSKGKRVIDISADYRFKDTAIYETHYGITHADPENLKKSVYGLSEWNRKLVKNANLVANPGCYPTGSILGIMPLIKNNVTIDGTIIIDAKSGVTGAGRKASKALLHGEIQENFKAYKVLKHQHEPEISVGAGINNDIAFVPHLLPVRRGILSTIYCKLSKAATVDKIHDIFASSYANERFVKVLPIGEFPELQYVRGTNQCHIGFQIDEKKHLLVVVTAIDNLLKGAAGQAVQNMNIMANFDEGEGLV